MAKAESVEWQLIHTEAGIDCPYCQLPSGVRKDFTVQLSSETSLRLYTITYCSRCLEPL